MLSNPEGEMGDRWQPHRRCTKMGSQFLHISVQGTNLMRSILNIRKNYVGACKFAFLHRKTFNFSLCYSVFNLELQMLVS